MFKKSRYAQLLALSLATVLLLLAVVGCGATVALALRFDDAADARPTLRSDG